MPKFIKIKDAIIFEEQENWSKKEVDIIVLNLKDIKRTYKEKNCEWTTYVTEDCRIISKQPEELLK